MVVAAHQVDVFVGRARAELCSVRVKGRVARCALRPGHADHHQTRIKVRLANGEVASCTYAWLD